MLLATAVILPTVCLLWFMTQAVRNERLAVRQKLVDVYQEKARKAVDSISLAPPDSRLVTAITHGKTSGVEKPLVVFSAEGRLLYPVWETRVTSAVKNDEWRRAWRLEFEDGNNLAAAAIYEKLADAGPDACDAVMAAARCYSKAGWPDKAAVITGRIAWPDLSAHGYEPSPEQVVRSRIMLVDMQLLIRKDEPAGIIRRALASIGQDSETEGCSTDVHVWALERLANIGSDLGDALKDEIEKARDTLASEMLSMETAERYPSLAGTAALSQGVLRRLRTQTAAYGMRIEQDGYSVLRIVTASMLYDDPLQELIGKVEDTTVECTIFDETGEIIAGPSDVSSQPLIRMNMDRLASGWTLALHFRNPDVFEVTARRQEAIYVWATILVISLIGSVAIVSGVSINRQMRLNSLKNDFIATITHELKTPLSSMRVLVDTLLAGDCTDEKQEKEYLELISRENLRLSRLIDNFLTFSRMERNKKAFDIQPCSAAEIVAGAVEAVKAKFEQNGCIFEHDVAGSLPEVMADRDAAVTVLVNLLDNACKYSGKDKRISLKAFAENGQVCFEVSDNGYGMTKKVMRRIFERFYQADQSLSRSAEGCGLGLSIVKFIIDAHNGRIDVRSKPDEGSCFTVRLPAVN